MTTYLIELYAPVGETASLEAAAARARATAEQMTREGKSIRYLRSTFVPEDEIWFHLYEAASADAVAEVSGRAGMAFDRIVEAVQVPAGGLESVEAREDEDEN